MFNNIYNPLSEKIVDILIRKTQSQSPLFFRVQTAYYLGKIASSMRCNIITLDRGKLPTNIYAMNLAVSGFGKGHSTSILEEEVVNSFFRIFKENTIPAIAESNLYELAQKRSVVKNTDFEEEHEAVLKEYNSLGEIWTSFSEGTSPAVKQMRHKLLMAGIGSLGFEMDEMASNIEGNTEVLTTFLEMYDIGKVKQKLTKNSSDNKRVEDMDGKTPANMLLFGTPVKLFDGGAVEKAFFSMLDTGYARRCFFGISEIRKDVDITPEELLDLLMDADKNKELTAISARLGKLADPVHYNKELKVSKAVSLMYTKYKLECERAANKLPEFFERHKSELMHRYFKALKLAGVYAFIDGNNEVTEQNMKEAISLTEECGEAFQKILKPEQAHVRLAKYLSQLKTPVTYADLIDDLPYFPQAKAKRDDLMVLAKAWGYTNNVIIKHFYQEGIEIFQGESLTETNTDELIVSYSKHQAYNYISSKRSFNDVLTLATADGWNFVNHALVHGESKRGHRENNSIIPEFNLLVLDVDGTAKLDDVRSLLKEFKYIIYTTKSHTADSNRFRIILPMNYHLKLDREEYRRFMKNVYDWLPFSVDTDTSDRCRKWSSCGLGKHYVNDGELLDVLPFIPKTSKETEFKNSMSALKNMNALERWFAVKMVEGQRNSYMIKYALMLVDNGLSISSVRDKVFDFNKKLPEPLEDKEIEETIMLTVSRRYEE